MSSADALPLGQPVCHLTHGLSELGQAYLDLVVLPIRLSQYATGKDYLEGKGKGMQEFG